MKITVDDTEITTLCKNGTTAIMDEEGEKNLARLLTIQKELDDFIEKVKIQLKENALQMDANFTGFTGDYVKLELRKFGGKYAVETPEKLDPAFIKREVKESLDTKAIAQYLNDTGHLPDGIEMLDREPQLVIKLKGDK